MDKFEASNGITVVLYEDGSVCAGEDPAGVVEADALREFFRAEHDEELGRWRYPKDPQFVVYPGFSPGENSRVARVVHEHVGTSTLVYEKPGIGRTSHPAATAYFEAHPERKPWHDAKPGEVWVIDQVNTVTTAARAGLVNERMKFEPVDNITRHIDVDDPSILDARRIWPEEA